DLVAREQIAPKAMVVLAQDQQVLAADHPLVLLLVGVVRVEQPLPVARREHISARGRCLQDLHLPEARLAMKGVVVLLELTLLLLLLDRVAGAVVLRLWGGLMLALSSR